MADKNDKSQDEDNTLVPVDDVKSPTPETKKVVPPPSSSAAKSDASNRNNSGSGLLWFFVVLNLLLVGTLAGAGYWYVQQYTASNNDVSSLQEQITAQVNQTEQSTQSVAAALDKLSTQQQTFSNQQSTLQSLSANSQQMGAEIDNIQAQLQELDGRRPADWLIAEADYLVRMAGRKVWLEQDTRTAIMLLANADKRLAELADPSVLPVRALIAQDVQSLQQLNPVSRTSIALALGGLIDQVEKLPLDTIALPDTTQSTSTEVSESVSDWQQNLLNVWHAIVDDFISVNYREAPVEPMMTQQHQYLLKQQLILHLQHARSAVLQAEVALYEQSLSQAATLINASFDTESSQVTGFLSVLTNLQQTDISNPLPTELAAQAPLAGLLEKRVQRVFGDGAVL